MRRQLTLPSGIVLIVAVEPLSKEKRGYTVHPRLFLSFETTVLQ